MCPPHVPTLLPHPRPTGKTVGMQKSLLPLPLVFVLLLSPSLAHAWPGAVMSIQDGDTLTVAPAGDTDCPVSVRLYGIDAPETQQAHGESATIALAELLPGGAMVEVIPMDTDKYGRVVALVAHAGKVVNGAMVAAGHAWVYAKYCRAAMCSGWYAAQKKAVAAKAGLWAGDAPQAPWVWRRK